MEQGITRRSLIAGGAALGLGAALGIAATGTPFGGGAQTIAFWHLFGGGDGVHLQAMLDELHKKHSDMRVRSLFLPWGNPYYTKLSLAAVGGSPPDVAISHATRLAEFAPANLLEPLDEGLLDKHGIGPAQDLPVAEDGLVGRHWWFNSLLAASLITVGTIFTASLAAFAFSRIRFRASNLLQWLVLAGLIVPFQALIVPLFQEIDSFGMADSYWGIILPQIATPISVLVFKRAFDSLPGELEESALIDGASPWRIYWQIWMPLSRSTIAAVGIFTFVIAWNNFIWPFVSTSSADLMTVPVGLATGNTGYGALYAQQMALAVLGALPLLAAFLIFQRQIVQGIANTGLKG